MRVFLSYSHENRDEAATIETELKCFGTVVRDTLFSSGDRVLDSIRNSVKKCQAFVVLLSPSSCSSPWVVMEFGAAWALEKPLYPIQVGFEAGAPPIPFSEFVAATMDELEHKLYGPLASLKTSLEANEEPSIPKLAEELAASVCEGTDYLSLTPWLERALDRDRDRRREAHGFMRTAPASLRRPFLASMRTLAKSSHARLRGEAFYCLGDIADETGAHLIGEEELCDGLDDSNFFVKACCANVLSNFAPLSERTVERLRTCEKAGHVAKEGDPNARGLCGYAARTLDVDRRKRLA